MDVFITKFIPVNFFYVIYDTIYEILTLVFCIFFIKNIYFNSIMLSIIIIVYTFKSNFFQPTKNKKEKKTLFFLNLILNLTKGLVSNFSASHLVLYYSVFCNILVLNFFGILPYFSAITASLVVVLSLAYSLFLFLKSNKIKTGNSIKWERNSKISFFLPEGLDKIVIPIVFVVEIVSYFVKITSVAIRLFANILAGHLLIKIAGASIFTVFSSFSLILDCSLIAGVSIFFLTSAVILLEFVIAFVQAYVFTVLFIIYSTEIS